MSKGKKRKIRNRRVAAPTVGSTIKADWPEITVEAAETAVVGVGTGLVVHNAFGVGDPMTDAVVGGVTGFVVGAAKGTLVCHRRRAQLVAAQNATLDGVADMFEEMSEHLEDEVAQSVSEKAAEFMAKAGLGSDADEDEDEDDKRSKDKKPTRKDERRAR